MGEWGSFLGVDLEYATVILATALIIGVPIVVVVWFERRRQTFQRRYWQRYDAHRDARREQHRPGRTTAA